MALMPSRLPMVLTWIPRITLAQSTLTGLTPGGQAGLYRAHYEPGRECRWAA